MKIIIFSLLLFAILTITKCNHPKTNDYKELPKTVSNEIARFINENKFSNTIIQAIKTLKKIQNKRNYSDIFCETCDLVIDRILNYRKNGANRESMAVFLDKLCNLLTDWGPVACQGYVNIEIDTILYIIDNGKKVTSLRICAISFQERGCRDPHFVPWSIPLPASQSPRLTPNQASAAPLRILQLTDLHYDPLYTPGSNADCELPLCCQAPNGKPTNASKAAGFWGDYHVCDMPWHSIVQLMKQANASHYDFVYYTGDIISHRSWATSKTLNVAAIQQVFKLLNDSFKSAGGIYPILGNHEPHPTDFYSPNSVIDNTISTKWIFQLAADEWKKWLPNDTISTILKGGYYTVLVKKGFRIIALNSNVCFVTNLWLLYEDNDPYAQLKWLVETLKSAEKNNEKVHILSHIPPGEIQCWQQWALQYRRIVERFAPIIVAQFNGHTHLDELRLFPDPNNTKRIINVAFNAGSFTTFVGLNPNYRIYDIDSANYTVLDYEHYTYNLTKANQNTTVDPEWYKLYAFKKAYGLNDTSLNSLANLQSRITKNHTLIRQYFRFQVRDSTPLVSKNCDDLCLTRIACTITAIEPLEALKCQTLKKTYLFEGFPRE